MNNVQMLLSILGFDGSRQRESNFLLLRSLLVIVLLCGVSVGHRLLLQFHETDKIPIDRKLYKFLHSYVDC